MTDTEKQAKIDAYMTSVARVSDTHSDDSVTVEGFTCMRDGSTKQVQKDDLGLYLECDEGKHHLDGQIEVLSDGTKVYIGIHKV